MVAYLVRFRYNRPRMRTPDGALSSEFTHDAGFVIEGIAKPGRSAVFTVAVHKGLSGRTVGPQSMWLEMPEAEVVRLAFYGPDVIDGSWQPFDQPAPSAYMPLPLSAFDRIDLPDGGAVLVQSHVRQQAVRTTVVNDGQYRFCEFVDRGALSQVRDRLARALVSLRIPPDVVDRCVRLTTAKIDSGRLFTVVPPKT